MTQLDERSALEAYARSDILRRELEMHLGREVTPAEAIVMLAKAGLPLPQVRSPEDSPGRQLLQQILSSR